MPNMTYWSVNTLAACKYVQHFADFQFQASGFTRIMTLYISEDFFFITLYIKALMGMLKFSWWYAKYTLVAWRWWWRGILAACWTSIQLAACRTSIQLAACRTLSCPYMPSGTCYIRDIANANDIFVKCKIFDIFCVYFNDL